MKSNYNSTSFNMVKHPGPKSNANCRNRTTRRADRVVDIPEHDMVLYVPSKAALYVDFEFPPTRSAGDEKEAFDSLIEIIPRYGNDTNIIHLKIIHLKMMFKKAEEDVEAVYRRETLAKVVEQINNLPHIKEISFDLRVDRFNWKQIDVASSIYRLKFVNWTFILTINDREPQIILADSRVDRELRAVERKLQM
ncbi:hypothetical protein BOTCAL_0298g00060 [Botryotinia calthae]|uniref:Uncharacterized protein n=1 Tax=Botryotinia calthae TaxID=38488 RepID=A0A4Y8CX49_9HELO|nr:hypothetical protein BOTCAL_0298g00060 [Botryotinia calthae]